MKKLLMFLLLGMFLISLTSAEMFSFDNQLSYGNKNKDLSITNLFGLGKHYADLKITSHEDLNKPIYVGTGWQEVMRIEIDSKQDYKNALKGIEFKNMKTGEYEELNYYWEKAINFTEEDIPNEMEKICGEDIYTAGNDSYAENCWYESIGTHKENIVTEWERFDVKDFNKEETIVRLMVYVTRGSHFDGIPELFGKKITGWAEWENPIDDPTNYAGWTSDITTLHYGTDFNIKHDTIRVTNVTKYASVTATKAYLYNITDGITLLSTATFIGSVATFPNGGFVLTDKSKVYMVVVGSDGESYTDYYKTPAASYPIIATNINWTSCSGAVTDYPSNCYAANGYNIVSLTSETKAPPNLIPTVTIINPKAIVYDTTTQDIDYIAETNGGTMESCWYSKDVGATNETEVAYGINWTGIIATEGSNTWQVSCNTTTGEQNTTSVTFTVDTTPMIYFSGATPNDYTNQSFNTLFANVTLTETYFDNVTFYLWNSSYDNINSTTFTDNTREINWTLPYDDTYTYNATIWTTTNQQNSTETRHLDYDSTEPFVEITYPIGAIDYHRIGDNLELNWTTNSDADNCWYTIGNGDTNTSVTCGTNTTNINITSSSITSLIFYANDTNGNRNSTITNWSYKIFENEIVYSPSTFETKTETYAINITANSSLTAVKLMFNNESGLSMTESSSNYWTYSRDVPLGSGNKQFYFNFTYAAQPYSSDNLTQEVNLTLFEYTKGIGDIFLNISFKDENTLSHINASIPTSTFTYYLGSGSVNKTLTFSNNTDNLEYNFNGTTGSESLYVIPSVQYRQVSDYLQRIWTPTLRTYNSTQTDQVLYLLSSDDGIYVTYQVLTSSGTPIVGVGVISTRVVSGETIQIGAGTTDAAGTITFWMNPDFQHISTFTKSGYDDYVFTHFPTQNSYTITLGGETGTKTSCIDGITQTIKPSQDFLWVNETYNFNYTTEIKFTLTGDGVVLGSDSSTSSSGDTIVLNGINTSSYSTITMSYYYDLDEPDDECGQITGTRVWIVQSSTGTEYGIWRLTEDFNTYISASLFGFDNFGKTLLSFIIIVLMVGGLSKRYGIASEGAIMGILFGTVFMLDVGLNMIPKVEIGEIVSINHFFTYITFIILFMVLIREEKR